MGVSQKKAELEREGLMKAKPRVGRQYFQKNTGQKKAGQKP